MTLIAGVTSSHLESFRVTVNNFEAVESKFRFIVCLQTDVNSHSIAANYPFLSSAQVSNQKWVLDKKEIQAQKGERGDKGAPGEPGLRGQPGSDVSNYRHFVTHYCFL